MVSSDLNELQGGPDFLLKVKCLGLWCYCNLEKLKTCRKVHLWFCFLLILYTVCLRVQLFRSLTATWRPWRSRPRTSQQSTTVCWRNTADCRSDLTYASHLSHLSHPSSAVYKDCCLLRQNPKWILSFITLTFRKTSPRLIAHYDLKLSCISQQCHHTGHAYTEKNLCLMQFKWIKKSEKGINTSVSNHVWLFRVSHLPRGQLFNLEWCQSASWNQIL